MLSEKCVRAVLSCRVGLGGVEEMSTLSVRAPGLQATTVLDTRSLRVRGVTTLDSVRKNLFGCVDREENRRFVERELARQTDLDNQRWGFDFVNEQPLPGSHRFTWHLVPATAVPTALRTPIITPKPSTPSQENTVSSPENREAQKRITEFLKPLKRYSSNGKKSPGHSRKHDCGGAHIRPPKVARLAQTLKRTS